MTINTPLVSVLVATYNKAAVLRSALESIRWQTLTDFEVWVIGDGCTDNSSEIVQNMGDERFHWINLPENSGYQSVPHNEGLRRARGKYIAYLNQDDLWLPHHLTTLVQTIDSQQAHFAYSILEWVQSTKPSFPDIPVYPAAIHPPEASSMLQRADTLKDLGYWKQPSETRALPRVDYFRRAQFKGYRFAFAPRLTVLKFDAIGKYDSITSQAEYVQRIKLDPQFSEIELSAMLVRAVHELDLPPDSHRLRKQVMNWLRLRIIRLNIDPSDLQFWKPKGFHLKKWRKVRKLD